MGELNVDRLNPAQQFVATKVRAITDEVAITLQDMDFLDPADWANCFDIATRFVRWSILAAVNNGEWKDAGIDGIHQLQDLEVEVHRTDEGIHIGIKMPTVMAVLRAADDPDAN